ncbi:hypothetical protein [Nitrospira moscoviensis]|uniref:Uncharacterized protein n=1 Tax=Nitrospira moscoviensis TaxID=42253 RepID=A0A0K2GBJ5_NITMO|nr:hypothetical protein [Nitrospira moscoviensis]ALA58341.1 exported protein of unknown function [Nitrospira moscoviensis]
MTSIGRLLCFLFTILPFHCVARAETPALTFEIPFDDVDPAVAQAEVARHVGDFLGILDAQWGADQEAIRGLVTRELERDDGGALIYGGTLLDHRVVEGYDFREGALVRGQYVVLQRPVNGLNEFIEYYAAVKAALTETYGAPHADQTIWNNDLYQTLPDYWGVAVQIGHLRYSATWATLTGDITVELTGNHHSRLTIEYRSKAFNGDARAI